MSVLQGSDPAFAGGATLGGTEWRLSRPAVVVSLLAHVVLLLAVGRVALDRVETVVELPTAELVWLGDLVRPSEPLEPAVPPSEEPIAPPPEPTPAPRATSPPAPATTTKESPPAEITPEEVAPPAPAPLPSRLDLDTARREAAAAVVEEHARAGKVLKFSLDDVVPPRAAPAQNKPSIFDHHRASAGSGVLSPGKARTAAGFRMRMWCNRLTGGGFGFFGIPVCASGRIGAPSGLLVESIPEYMKLKPECEETRPLAAALGETSPYPTVKCRLVPKDADEAAVLDDETGR